MGLEYLIFSPGISDHAYANCDYTPTHSPPTVKPTHIPLEKFEVLNENPTVMLLGTIGSGKSFLANALIGQKHPNRGPFKTGSNAEGKKFFKLF